MNDVVETHTGLVFLVGDRAYKVKKPVTTDFLDFATPQSRERACAREVMLNSRLAPASYLGVAHVSFPDGRQSEPVIVMRRHPDERRLATMVRQGVEVNEQLVAVAAVLARFHAEAHRGREVDEEGRLEAVAARWQASLTELADYAQGRVPGLDAGVVAEINRCAMGFIAGRAVLFVDRIRTGRIVDGHADLLADDIFCLPDGPALLDCLEFDDRLRYVDVIDDAAFLAMDLEFLGRRDLGDFFLQRYRTLTGDESPDSLRHFYISYRAVVRAKVDCVRFTQGHPEAGADAGAHLEIALAHLRAGAVRLILIGGGPGTGKTTLAHGIADHLDALVVSTDDVRSEMTSRGEITGAPGALGEGLYSTENIDAVYAAVLRKAHLHLCEGRSVIVDGTWTEPRHREQARAVAEQTSAAVAEIVCAAKLETSVARIRSRTTTTSQATPEIATALAGREHRDWPTAHRVDTTGPLAESVAQGLQICRLTY